MTTALNKRSQENLKEVAPSLVKLWTRVNTFVPITVVEGKRSKARQEELVKSGASKKTDSKHCVEPLAEATDVVPSDFNWSKPNEWKELRKLYYLAGIVKALSLEMGIKIRWGGDWDSDSDFTDQTFNDLVHYELIT
jgi:peptidoglycan L-alanyl-D-glutamate endopeptidase CwlK